MKIETVDSFMLSLPYRTSGGFHYIAGRPSNALAMLLVRIRTTDGLTGWGEAFGHAGAVATKSMIDSLVAPLLVGEDARDIGTLMESVRRKIHLFGLSGPAVYAISGIDIALWDLRGKREGKSVSDLLGKRRHELPVYASFLRCSSDEALEKTCSSALGEGYGTVKLHEITLERIRLARRSLGEPTALAVDTNCPWSVEQSKEVLAAVRDLNLRWIEEPVWPPDDYAGLARLRGAGTPISAGENTASIDDFERLLAAKAVDILQPSVCKVGGITEMLKILTMADKYGVEAIPHCGYMGSGYLANLHIVASLQPEIPVERLYVELEESPFPMMPVVAHGHTVVPAGPGLGCDPDMRIVEKWQAT
ncbi:MULTISPECIES: mandelate racemase/muconate lactonizing enzyme family protein [unclassified Mesorhizobium]|uniref:mandelate racemase/muconate lactonizing enzyme family protein n=1 Tax=unclassified Mesorhizobium TaxID=325217 RepID=UPI0011284B04|nr:MULTISPECIES: mandelate racemase/muconate lactonizing enzyme family protein [unclassified Mesorhizobium]MBZ9699565.1 mandelate racemase/muconate lactonizing enzyme family protein [Mesorhizobium sp. CO1-1-3]MBZ9945817.1 mandelate racemase/muconate lactonizing enzyme family protein [Mesorhizobium sp. BR1-1-11]TPM40430.1 mandelate racemase/muconate lactonizing enzyme family protein [Mesorhizobium sp. B2-2-3]